MLVHGSRKDLKITQIETQLRSLGYRYVTLDLRGFRSGSMNEVLLGDTLRNRGAF